MFCGLPVEMDNYPRESLGVHRRHGPIAELDQVEALLEALAADAALGAYRAADEGAVGLGLDLDELHPAGRLVPVAATPVRIGHAVDAPEAAVWATATPLTASGPGGPPVDVRLEWDAGRRAFCGLLPGFAPGLVQVSVTARALTDEPAVQVVEVLDAVDLE